MSDTERENYFILLDLAYDPPVTDTGRIKSALRAKKQEWTRMQDNPNRCAVALNYLGQAAEMERVLLDPALREKEAQDARKIKVEMLRQFEAELRVLESKRYIQPREAAAIAVKYKPYGVTQSTVEDYAKCPISETPPPPSKNDGGEVLDRATAKTVQRDLAILGNSTLYAFLGELPYSPVKKLVEAAEQKRLSAASSGADAAVIQELASICAALFETIGSKQKYDRYLKISKYPAVNELVDEEYARSQYISPEVILRISGFAVEKYDVKVLEAEEYIKAYCQAYSIPTDSSGLKINCPACTNKTLREGAACTTCGQPINGYCPACGSQFEHGPASCGACGFLIGDMARGLRYLGDAETALIENNWGSAKRSLQYTKKYWPGHPKLETLEKRTLMLEERYAKYMESIDDCIERRQLYAAQELIREASDYHMRLPSALIAQVEQTIAEFEERLFALQSVQKNPDVAVLLCLLDEVSDSMELSRLLSLYPPEPPAKIVSGVTGRHVRLTWSMCQGAGASVTYLLVRKQGSAPLTAFDGDLLYDGAANSFLDKTAQPLAEHYYRVFSKRAGTYSRTGAETEPILLLPDIEGLRALPVDGGAQLTWEFNPHIRGVEIWRKLGGDAPTKAGEGILLENDRLDGYSDTKLKNDIEYWYYISAVYIIDGRRFVSRGICDSVVPHKTVAPVEDLAIAPTDADSEYIVSWDGAQHEDIILLCSTKKPAFRTGDIFLVEELVTTYRKLDLDYKTAESARFKLGVSGGTYLFAAAVFGRFATVGEPRYLINVAEIEHPACSVIGGSLYLNMKWPTGVNEVAVVYRFDRHPKRPEEAGSTKLVCTREQYDFDAAAVIKEPEPNIYYMTIYAAFTSPDGGKVYSRGVEFTVNNQPLQEIYYKFNYRKRFLSSMGILEVTLSSDETFVLPKAVIVGKTGRLPLSRSDGLPLFEVEKELRVSGNLSLQFNTKLLPRDSYIRMFLRDDALYKKFRLVPVSGMKIT